MVKSRVARDRNPLTKRKNSTDDRRSRVATQLLNRITVEQISINEGVSTTTIFKDKRALERIWQRELAEDYLTLRMREYLALERMEQEAIKRYDESNPTDPRNFLPHEDEMSGQRIQALVAENGKWFDRRLKIMESRCKILGLFPRADQVNLSQYSEDNRQVIQITVSPPAPENTEFFDKTKKNIPFGEWAYGVLNPPTEEQLNGNNSEGAKI